MPSTANVAVTTLIVVSRDVGELALCRSLLRDQRFAKQAVVAMPENLFATQREAVSAAVVPYATHDDILEIARSHRPDLVLLLSAYLLALEGPLFPNGLRGLLTELRRRDCQVATSDPFVGLGPSLTVGDIDPRMLLPGQSSVRRWLLRGLLRLQRRSARMIPVPELEGVAHLYPAGVPDAPAGIERLPVFNPATIPTTLDDGAPKIPAAKPRWLFVLSPRDLHVQLSMMHLRDFIQCLLGVIRHTVESDALATLIAPAEITSRLEPAAPAGTELMAGCPMTGFEAQVLKAEYVFYWNTFSFSQIARIVNDKPVFYFDRGFYARAIRPFYDRARETHFGDWNPTCLDQRQLFSRYVLAHLAKTQRPVFAALRERWKESPTPDEVVMKLVHREVPSAIT